MKITKDHYNYMANVIGEFLEKHNSVGQLVAQYERGDFVRSEFVKDLQMRFCFDILYGANINFWMSKYISPYANSAHIYTALKRICPKVTKRF